LCYDFFCKKYCSKTKSIVSFFSNVETDKKKYDGYIVNFFNEKDANSLEFMNKFYKYLNKEVE
jgi:hypothetical protein